MFMKGESKAWSLLPVPENFWTVCVVCLIEYAQPRAGARRAPPLPLSLCAAAICVLQGRIGRSMAQSRCL